MELFKQSITEELFQQCENYFRNDVNKLIAETKDEVEKYLASLEKSWWNTALVMGALVVGGAGLAVAAVAAAPVVLGALAVDAAVVAAGIGTGTAATAGAGMGSTAAAGYGAGTVYTNYKLKRATDIIKTKQSDAELALTKYEESVIHVMLCFGAVEIKLLSNVKLT